MDNKENELSFFRKMFASIFKIEKYPEFASKKWIKIIPYIFKLLILLVTISSLCSLYIVYKQVNNTLNYIEQNIPNFNFENNILKTDNQEIVILENEDEIFSLFIIDTNQNLSKEKVDEYKNKLDNVQNGIIFLDKMFIIKSNITQNGIKEYNYFDIASRYEIDSFNKQDLLSNFSGSNIIMIYLGVFIITFVYMYIIYCISIILDVLLLGIFGQITALFMRLRLRYSAMCKVAVYALTLPILLNGIAIILETFMNFNIKYFQVMYIGIACIYIVATILIIKSDVIKSKEELQKIIEEQARVKEELDKKEQEEQEKKRREEKKKNEKNKKDEDKDKDKVDNEPQGENA